MSLIASALKHMLAAGMPHEAIIAAVEEMEATLKPAKSARSERNARYYENHREELRLKASEQRLNTTEASETSEQDNRVSSPVPKETSPLHPPKEITLNPTIPSDGSGALRRDFVSFYQPYPHKVGKAAAEKAYISARRRADHATIIAGLHRYIESKPPDRPWCNPATWLNQDRWLDHPSEPLPRQERRNERPNDIASAFDRLEARYHGRANHAPVEPERDDGYPANRPMPAIAGRLL